MPLTAQQLDELTEPLEVLFERFYQSVIEDMARRLARIDMSNATAYQAWRMRESGLLYDELLARLSKLTGLTTRELRRAFERYGVRFTEKDEAIYRKAGLDPVPLRQSPAMLNALEAGLRKTGMVANNLTMTTAVTTQQAFIDAADLAYMQVSTGTMTYQSAIREGVLSLVRRGLTVISFPSGRIDQADVAMRRTVLTGVAQTTGVMQLELAREMGCDLVEVDAHFGARNHGTGPMNHESWQGKIYSISGTDRRYPSLIETTGYGTIVGLYGVNCRHSCYPYIEGVSEPSYSNGELREMKERKVTYNGEELTYYDATQKQRAIERAIRKAKREAGALEAAGLDNTAERVKLGQYQAKMRDFLDQTGLVRDRLRESVPGMNVRGLNSLPASQNKKIQSSPSISSAFTYGKQHTTITETLDAIDAVHNVSNLPIIPIRVTSKLKQNVAGEFRSTNSGVPYDIRISSTASTPRMTVAHEIGHFIDLSGIKRKGFFAESKINGALSEWWQAVENSNAYKEWLNIERNGGLVDINGNLTQSVDAKFVQYSRSPSELWARSYAQFIATESSNGAMKAELAVKLTNDFPNQWEETDFSPIGKAIYNLLKGMGWTK